MTVTSALVPLAARNVSQKLLGLLPAHKIALLSIERASATELRAAVQAAHGRLEQFRVARTRLRAVQIVTLKLAYRHAVKELLILGVTPPPPPPTDQMFFNRALNDLRRSIMSTGLTGKVKAQRAALAASVIANRTYSERQLATYLAAMAADPSLYLQKVWVTNKTAGTPPCPACTKLDGTAVHTAAEFPAPSGLTVYGDLQVPPLHPRCRCRTVARLVKV